MPVTNDPEPRIVAAGRVEDLLKQRGIKPLRIEDPVLYELITYGDGMSRTLKRNLGSWSHGGRLPQAVLTFLAQRAFAIHRLPWHHDRSHETLPMDGDPSEALAFMSDQMQVDSACEELRFLRDHTVNSLRSLGITHVRLRRGLTDSDVRVSWVGEPSEHVSGYASRVVTMAALASKLGRKAFNLPMNVLSSWSGGGYTHLSIVVEHEIPVEDVGWCWRTVAPWDEWRTHAAESGEWVIVNRAADGRLALGVSCVVHSRLPPNAIPTFAALTKTQMEQELEHLESIYGNATSMYRDVNCTRCEPLTLQERVRRAWVVFKNRYA